MMRRFSMLFGATAVVLCSACGALKPPKAQFSTISASPIVFALNGGPPATPAGIDFLTASAVPVDANFYFNIALDIDSAGNVVIYPARRIANGLSAAISVGLQAVPDAYADYVSARKSGYTYDSTLVVPVGKAVAVNVLDATTCTVYSLGSSYFAKFVVDSIDRARRVLYTEVASDPNCGYVSLAPGVPTK
ncbi:MAG TPA: hypothetical protein VF737_04905 [Gemmatimonadaceae bacterium]